MNDLTTKLINGAHLLYIAGDEVDYLAVEVVVKSVPHFPLGPFCWIVTPPAGDRGPFADRLKEALPALPNKCEPCLSG